MAVTAPPIEAPRERWKTFGRKVAEYKRREARKLQSQRGGLIHFVRYFWHVLEPERKLVEGWPLEALCEHYEAVAFGEVNRLLVNVPPGFMKSMLLNVFFPAWVWGALKRPHIRFLAFSYSSTLTERDNGKFRDLITSTEYQGLWGSGYAVRNVGVERVDNNKTGWKAASSVGGTTTGLRADYVLADDLHSIAEAESETVRLNTVRWFVESMSNRLNDLDESAIIVLGQRVHEGDVSGEILDPKSGMDYVHLMIPWEYDAGRHCRTAIGWEDPRTEDGDPAWPERFSASAMAVFKARPFMFASQYQQAPAPRGGGIIKREFWRLWDPEDGKTFPPFKFILASLDTAFTTKQENDYSALTIWGVFEQRVGDAPNSIWIDNPSSNGKVSRTNVPLGDSGYGQPRLMLMYGWRKRCEFHELVTTVAKICDRNRVDRLLIEDKAAGHSVAQEMRRVHADAKWGVTLFNPKNQDKVARVHSIEHLFEDGLIFAPDREWAEMVIGEFEVFPRGVHDDLVDSGSQALRHLRDIGLLQRRVESEREYAESAQFKPRREPLYPV